MSRAVVRARPRAASWRWRRGCWPVSAESWRRWARRVGQAGSSVRPGMWWSTASRSAMRSGPMRCSAAAWEAVGVALDGAVQPGGGVVEFAQGRGR